MKIKESLLLIIILLVISILFIPQDRKDIVVGIIAVLVVLGIAYWKIRKK